MMTNMHLTLTVQKQLEMHPWSHGSCSYCDALNQIRMDVRSLRFFHSLSTPLLISPSGCFFTCSDLLSRKSRKSLFYSVLFCKTFVQIYVSPQHFAKVLHPNLCVSLALLRLACRTQYQSMSLSCRCTILCVDVLCAVL